VQTTAIFGVEKESCRNAVDEENPSMIAAGIGDHFNLIFPVYLKLMTGFPFVYQEEVGAEFLH